MAVVVGLMKSDRLRRKPGYYTLYTDIIDKIYKQAKKMARITQESASFAQVGQKCRDNGKNR